MRKENPEYLLVLPWHFKDEIIEREKEYLNQDVETLKIEYEKTINDYNNLVSEFEKLKEENIRKSEKYSHLEKDLENQNILQNIIKQQPV